MHLISKRFGENPGDKCFNPILRFKDLKFNVVGICWDRRNMMIIIRYKGRWPWTFDIAALYAIKMKM